LRSIVRRGFAVLGVDLASAKQAAVLTDHDSVVVGRRMFTGDAWVIDDILDWAAPPRKWLDQNPTTRRRLSISNDFKQATKDRHRGGKRLPSPAPARRADPVRYERWRYRRIRVPG
jgi:hypothetical protein